MSILGYKVSRVHLIGTYVQIFVVCFWISLLKYLDKKNIEEILKEISNILLQKHPIIVRRMKEIKKIPVALPTDLINPNLNFLDDILPRLHAYQSKDVAKRALSKRDKPNH